MNLIHIRQAGTSWALCAALVITSTASFAQQAGTPAATAPTTIKSTAEEVVLDVVVRDKKGKPIKDLTADDFSVMDNGTKQQIKSFRLVEGTEAIEKGSKVAL